MLKQFNILDLGNLELANATTKGRVMTREVGAAIRLDLSRPVFEDDARIAELAGTSDHYDGLHCDIPVPHSHFLRDVDLFTKYGALALDETICRESLFSYPWHFYPNFAKHGKQYHEYGCDIVLPEGQKVFPSALDACAGINENYYHWMVLFLPRINDIFIKPWRSELTSEPVVLLPPYRDAVQRESAEAIAEHFGLKIVNLSDEHNVHVEQCVYPVHLRRGGLYPHTLVSDTFKILKNKFYSTGCYPEKIYISRKDSRNRIMLNEEDVEIMLRHYGYEVITLTGMTLADQINIFANSKRIIGGHGAGLTNLGFASPGTRVLEIHMQGYYNWCYRRLAGLMGVEYDFISGEIWGDGNEPLHQRNFMLPLDKLETYLSAET
jgi:capsular polysaccharide biosynthesis protein